MLYPQHRNERLRVLGYIDINDEDHCYFYSYNPLWKPVRITTAYIVPGSDMKATWKYRRAHSTSMWYDDYIRLLNTIYY